MDIIDIDDLSADLDSDLSGNARAASIVARTNALITQEWNNPVTPAPASVFELALAVAHRALASVPGRGAVESITRSFDDSARTERFSTPGGDASGRAVYLNDDELAQLNGGSPRGRVGSIKLAVPRHYTSRPGTNW